MNSWQLTTLLDHWWCRPLNILYCLTIQLLHMSHLILLHHDRIFLSPFPTDQMTLQNMSFSSSITLFHSVMFNIDHEILISDSKFSLIIQYISPSRQHACSNHGVCSSCAFMIPPSEISH